jgi:hypothetical protein
MRKNNKSVRERERERERESGIEGERAKKRWHFILYLSYTKIG